MKNKKGFTLVELLAVIVVLAIILTIAVGSVTSAINKTKEATKYAAAKEIVAIAEAYMEEHNIKYVTVGELITKDYLESDATNPRTGESGFVGDDVSQVIIKPDLSDENPIPIDEGEGHYYISGYIFIKDANKLSDSDGVKEYIKDIVPESSNEGVNNKTCNDFESQANQILVAAKSYFNNNSIQFVNVSVLVENEYYSGTNPFMNGWGISRVVINPNGTQKPCKDSEQYNQYFYEGYQVIIRKK